MKAYLIILLLAILSFSCQKKADPGIELIESYGTLIPKINIEQIEKEQVVRFSDWFEDIHLIELEATENSMIERVLNTYVGFDYIIVSTMKSGILHFTADGKFVKSLAKRGRGPGEVFEMNTRIFVDKTTDKVYITLGYQQSKVLCVDIPTGEFEYIPYANSGPEPFYDCPIVKDGLMYCATITFTGQKSTHPVFCQTTSGKLIWEIERNGPKNSPNARTFLVDDQLYFGYTKGDTLFKISEGNIIPHLILSSSSPRATFPKVEENQVDFGIRPIFRNWFEGYFLNIGKVDWEQGREGFPKIDYGKRTKFLYNQENQKLFRIGESYVNDYWDAKDPFDLSIQTNGIAFAKYQAIDLIEFADSTLQQPGIDPDIQKRLRYLLDTIQEDGNPCLLIGTVKDGV